MLEHKVFSALRSDYIYGGLTIEQAAVRNHVSIVGATALAHRHRWAESKAIYEAAIAATGTDAAEPSD